MKQNIQDNKDVVLVYLENEEEVKVGIIYNAVKIKSNESRLKETIFFSNTAGADLYDPEDISKYNLINAKRVFCYKNNLSNKILEKKVKSYEKLYSISSLGIVTLEKGEYNEEEDKYLNTHIFNKMGPRKDKTFCLMPFGYKYNYNAICTTNELGFRINEDLENLKNRNSNHKLIVITGGSGAFSIFSQNEDCFSNKLQLSLNNAQKENKYTVLNFGLGGGVVINDIINYILYIQPLKPEFVINHSGANDLRFGIISDSCLISKYDITYLGNIVAWSKQLYDHNDKYLEYFDSEDVSLKNLPSESTNAFVNRLLQFKRIVESNGTTFVFGLQPTIWSKGSRSEIENENIIISEKETSQGRFKTLNSKLPFLYSRLKILLTKVEFGEYLDLDQIFKDYGEDRTLFNDNVHTLPAGDSIISNAYLKHFRDIYL